MMNNINYKIKKDKNNIMKKIKNRLEKKTK